MKKETYKKLSIIVFIVGIAVLSAIVIPLMFAYNDPKLFNSFIKNFGIWGIAVMFFIQVAQVIVALIPGELVEFVAGTLYGWFGGLVFCLAGIAAGQYIIFNAVKKYGAEFVESFSGSKAMEKFKFLKNEKKLKTVVFVLFFIPGTPKDLITYMVPFTKMSLKDFMVISLLARIPSTVSSTFAGGAFAEKDFVKLAIAYAVIAAISIAGVIVYRKWEDKRAEKLKTHEKEKKQTP